jgi:hypothetical protein
VNKALFSLAAAASTISAAAIVTPAQANNTIGPSVSFNNGNSSVGVDGKFAVSENLSLRPFAYFPSSGTNYGGSLTYDFAGLGSNGGSALIPFVGAGYEFSSINGTNTTNSRPYAIAGADFALSDSIDLRGSVGIPLNNNNGNTTSLNVGAALRF